MSLKRKADSELTRRTLKYIINKNHVHFLAGINSVLFFVLMLLSYLLRTTNLFALIFILSFIFACSILLWYKQFRNFGLILVTVGLCFFVIEFVLALCSDRNLTTRTEIYSQNNEPSKTFYRESELGYQPNPGVFIARKFSNSNRPIYDVIYTIDMDGTRVTPEASADSKFSPTRINFFGGSFMFGTGLNDNQTLPYYVSQLLHVRVKNYSAPGYGAHQAYYIMKNLDLSPESQTDVFLTSAFHSERSYCIPFYSDLSPRYRLKRTADRNVIFQDGVCGDPVFGKVMPMFLVRILRKFRMYLSLKQIVMSRSDREEEFRLYIELIRAMNNISEFENRTFVVLYVDAQDEYFEGSRYSNDLIISLLKESGIRVINVSLDVTGVVPAKYYLDLEDKHPSSLANQLRAEILVNQLKSIKWY